MPKLFSWLNCAASAVITLPSGPVSGLHMVTCWPLPASEHAPVLAAPPAAGALVAAVPAPPAAGALVAAVPAPLPPHAAIRLANIASRTARHNRRDMAFILSLLAIMKNLRASTHPREIESACGAVIRALISR